MTRVFITGSSTGLGLLAARRLRERGHAVTVHARDHDRARDVRADLPDAPVVVGDLATTAGTRDVVAQVAELGRHQAVIHNAAVYRVPRRVGNGEGLSLTFAVNVLAPYLLIALLPRPDRLVLMTSGMQEGVTPGLDDAQWTRRSWNWMQAYAESKLFDTAMAFAAARRWPSVHANAVSPGWVPTRMGGSGAPDDLELGVDTQVWLAEGTDPACRMTGEYLFHRRPGNAPRATRDPDLQDALLDYCAQLTDARWPD